MLKDLEATLEDLQRRILSCKACGYVNSWEGQSIESHKMPPHWCWWSRNKCPCERELYYTFFKYDGASNVVFVALRPSTAWAPDTSDFFLANALKDCKLVKERFELIGNTFIFYEGAMVTDLIKCRGKAKDPIKDVPKSCLEFLKEELNIVKSHSGEEAKIVAVGRGVQRLLWKCRVKLMAPWKSKDDIPYIWLHNYARLRGKRDVEQYYAYLEYKKQVSKVLTSLKTSSL